MEIGVSTATLFLRKNNEDSLVTLNQLDARVCEIFLESFCEYNKEYGEILKERLGNLKVHSIHTLNTHFEPQLFSINDRAKNDAISIFKNVLEVAQMLGCKNYTLHGKARFKKNVNYDRYEKEGNGFNLLTEITADYGVELCLENVEWAFYNKPGFFSNIKPYAQKLKTCLDIKQARISGYDYTEYLREMGKNLNTVHISDFTSDGKVCLPKNGGFDFYKLFSELKEIDFKGNVLIEVYKESFEQIDEIGESLIYLRNIKKEVFGE